MTIVASWIRERKLDDLHTVDLLEGLKPDGGNDPNVYGHAVSETSPSFKDYF